MQNEERELKEDRAKAGQALRTLVNNKGWKEILVPAFQNQRRDLVEAFKSVKKYEEFVRIQQALNAIDNLLNTVDTTIELGEQAEEELSKQA